MSSRPNLINRLVLLKPGEGPILVWATAYFFLLLMSYYLLRPMREAFGIAKGADKLPWLMTGTLLAMLVANPLYAAVAARLPRRRIIPITYRFFGAAMLLFWLAFRILPGHGGGGVGYAFYIWLSVFNLFVVSVFWGLIDDLFNEEMGKRLFGLITIGGTLGAVAGSALSVALSKGVSLVGTKIALDPPSLLLLAALLLEAAVQCMKQLASHFDLPVATGGTREPGPGILEGLRLVATSRYLQSICYNMLLFTVTSTMLYLLQGKIVEHTFTGQATRTAAFANLDLWTNLVTLFTQLFLSGRLLTWLGVRPVLCLLPLLTIVGFASLHFFPSFEVMAVFMVLRRGLNYAVDRPAKEILYIPLGPAEKYKAKPFIDTFVYRAGDLLGVWSPKLLGLLALPLGTAALALSALWLGTGLSLGNQWRRLRPSTSDKPSS